MSEQSEQIELTKIENQIQRLERVLLPTKNNLDFLKEMKDFIKALKAKNLEGNSGS